MPSRLIVRELLTGYAHTRNCIRVAFLKRAVPMQLHVTLLLQLFLSGNHRYVRISQRNEYHKTNAGKRSNFDYKKKPGERGFWGLKYSKMLVKSNVDVGKVRHENSNATYLTYDCFKSHRKERVK